MQARYYDPVIGRFYSNDPIGFRDVYSFNRYTYANNNPYRYIDPDGQESISAQQFDIEVRGVGSGQITRAQHSANVSGRASASRHIAKLNPIGRTVLAVLSTIESVFNESSEESAGELPSEASEDESSQREKGDRWTSDKDAEEQFQGISKEQTRRRSKNKDNTSIESTEKSKQRADNALKPQNIDLDNLE